MAKLNPFLVRNVMLITLVAAAFSCVMGINWPTRQPSQGRIAAKNATIQPSPFESVPQEIDSNSEGNASPNLGLVQTEKGIFPAFGKQKAIAPSPLFPNLPQDKIPPPAQAFKEPQKDNVSSIKSSSAKSGETLPAFLHPNKPQNNTTPPGEELQEPPSNGISQDRISAEEPATTFWVPPEFQAKIVKKIIPVAQMKVIALTFDDGPWPSNTLKILDILNKNNIKATFFWVGQALKDNPQIGKQVVAQGHVIGNHTWHHWYRKLDPSTAAHEIDDTAELIYKTTGVRTSLFRPPGGVMNNGVADYAIQKKNVIVMWSNDPMDYRPHSANQLVNYVMRKAKPGAIVLMHDGGGNHSATVQALPQIIAKLRKQGYEFVTIPELLELRDPKASTVIAKKDLPSTHIFKP